MKEYSKINSIYKREMYKKGSPFIIGDWSEPEFEYLQNNQWEFNEKIDGTNIRVLLDGDITFKGKSDESSIPAHLVAELEKQFLPIQRVHLLKDVFGNELKGICLYGEGYGYKIQGKVGVDYLTDKVGFTLYDVKIGNVWLERKNVYDIALKLGLTSPVVVGYGTIHEAVELVKKGFKSAFGNAQAEGLVLRPVCELLNRKGERIITKIKCRDFKEDYIN